MVVYKINNSCCTLKIISLTSQRKKTSLSHSIMFKVFIEAIWKIIQIICVLYAFGTIIWKSIPRHWRENLKVHFRGYFRKWNGLNKSTILERLLMDDLNLIGGCEPDYGISFSIDKEPAKVPDDFKIIGDRFKRENECRLREGKNPVFTELFPYAVHSISVFRDQDQSNKVTERPMCHVVLRPSSFYYSLIAVEAMDDVVGPEDTTIREKYYTELLSNPLNLTPQGYDIVHAFGMNTLVLTKDHSFVFSKRNRETVATGQGCLHLSVGEHLNKDVLDFGNDGTPDAVQVIVKGLYQELGIKQDQINKSNIRFYGFTFSKSTCRYGMLGFTHLSELSDEDIRTSWELSKDGHYESEELVFVKANIKSIVDYLNSHSITTITRAALLNACLALMLEPVLGRVSQKQIDKALNELRSNAISR